MNIFRNLSIFIEIYRILPKFQNLGLRTVRGPSDTRPRAGPGTASSGRTPALCEIRPQHPLRAMDAAAWDSLFHLVFPPDARTRVKRGC